MWRWSGMTSSSEAGELGLISANSDEANIRRNVNISSSFTTLPQVRGGTSSRVVFMDAIPATFTICSVSRYDGPNRGRIINGDDNWLHGHWRGPVGAWKAPLSMFLHMCTDRQYNYQTNSLSHSRMPDCLRTGGRGLLRGVED